MDYETADGSQFSLRTIESLNDSERPMKTYVSVSAFVDGKAFCGRLEKDIELLEDEEILACLQPVPSECIHPPMPDGHPIVSHVRPEVHYVKSPSFTFEGCEPGNTFVADCLLNEASVLEQLRKRPNPNLARYHGAVVDDGRIKQLCLQKYDCSLTQYLTRQDHALSRDERLSILGDIESGIKHLHELGLAHNDMNPDNVCVDSEGRAVIVDFDSCLAHGEKLLKGVCARGSDADNMPPVSDPENDWRGLDGIADMLLLGQNTSKTGT